MSKEIDNVISWKDFESVDIRVGTVITANPLATAVKPAYVLEIDFGHMGIKKSSAQLTALYSPESLIGRQVLAVVNFPPKQIANIMSECLVLGLYATDDSVVLIQPDRTVYNGCKLG